jgi:hypothetical protein
MEKLKKLLQSRKFWVLVAALTAVCAGYATGQLSPWEALQGGIAALAVYSTGIAIVDAGAAAGQAGPQ